MKQETIKVRTQEIAFRIQQSEVEAIRKKDITKKGVRVFEGDKIGISGAIGDVDESVLIEQAKENLKVGIEYPFELEVGKRLHRNYKKSKLDGESLLKKTEYVLKELKSRHPDIDFSEKFSMSEVQVEYKNSEGLELIYEDAFLEAGVIIKEKASANVFDGFLTYLGRTFDEKAFVAFNDDLLKAHMISVSLPDTEKMPVFMMDIDNLTYFLGRALNGENYATGSSLFSDQLGEKRFNDKVTVYESFDSDLCFRPFFDHEGVVLPQDERPLIESGTIKQVFTDKRIAAQYNLPHTGGASGDYDGMPTLNQTTLRFKVDSKDIKAALNGTPAVFVVAASGGDFTPDGSYATPIQVSYLFDGEKIIGKLPEFTAISHLDKMLGEDYIGTFNNPFYMGENSVLQGYAMNIKK